MPSTPSLPRPASRMALRTASTAIARVLRADCRLYSVSPTPTMQYLSLSDAMALLDVDGDTTTIKLGRATLRQRRLGRQARLGSPGDAPGLAAGIVIGLRGGALGVQDDRQGAGGLGGLDADDVAQARDRVADAPSRGTAGARPVALLAAGGQSVLQHLAVAHDDRERVVDLVGRRLGEQIHGAQ